MGNKLLLAPLDLKHLGGQSVLDSGTGTGEFFDGFGLPGDNSIMVCLTLS